MYKTHQTGEMQTGILSHQVAVRNFIEQLKYYHLSCKQWKQKWQLVSVTALEFWTRTCRCIFFLVSWPVHPWLHRYPPCSWTSELCVMGHGYGPCVAASAQGASAVTSPPFAVDLWHTHAAGKLLPHPVTPLQQTTLLQGNSLVATHCKLPSTLIWCIND